MKPTQKDMAEFFRISLLAGLCEPSVVSNWACSIVGAEQSPHIAFIELCIAGSQPASSVRSLLNDVPAQPTPDLPVRMLLGHASRLVAAKTFTPQQLLLRIYQIALVEAFPESIYFELDRLEDDFSLVRDGAWGTHEENAHNITRFFNEYSQHAPDNTTGNA